MRYFLHLSTVSRPVTFSRLNVSLNSNEAGILWALWTMQWRTQITVKEKHRKKKAINVKKRWEYGLRLTDSERILIWRIILSFNILLWHHAINSNASFDIKPNHRFSSPKEYHTHIKALKRVDPVLKTCLFKHVTQFLLTINNI